MVSKPCMQAVPMMPQAFPMMQPTMWDLCQLKWDMMPPAEVGSVSPQDQSNLSQQQMASQPCMQAIPMMPQGFPMMPPAMWMPPTMWNPFLGMHPSALAGSAMVNPLPTEVPDARKSQMPSNPKVKSLITLAAEAQGKPPRRQKQKATVRFCGDCGGQVERDFKFCRYCGGDVSHISW